MKNYANIMVYKNRLKRINKYDALCTATYMTLVGFQKFLNFNKIATNLDFIEIKILIFGETYGVQELL